MSGNGNFAARSALTQPHASHSQISSHRYYIINIIFTEITVTSTQLTRALARLITGGISPCGDVV